MRCAVDRLDRQQARHHRLAVDQHGARAAGALVAAAPCAGQSLALTQHVDERGARRDQHLAFRAIDGQRDDGMFHGYPPGGSTSVQRSCLPLRSLPDQRTPDVNRRHPRPVPGACIGIVERLDIALRLGCRLLRHARGRAACRSGPPRPNGRAPRIRRRRQARCGIAKTTPSDTVTTAATVTMAAAFSALRAALVNLKLPSAGRANETCVTSSSGFRREATSFSTGSMRVADPFETVAVAPSAIRQAARSP